MAYEFVDEPTARYEFVDEPPKPKSTMDRAAGMVREFAVRSPIGAALRLGGLVDDAPYQVGGLVTDALSGRVSPETAGAAGYVANVGMQAIPTVLGGLGGEAVGKPVMQAAARRTMQSALKPTIADLRTGKAANAISTMLDEGVNVSPGGLAKLRAKIFNLNAEISDAIKNSPATVDKTKAAEELRGLLDKFGKQVNPKSDVGAIETAWAEFLSHPLLAGKQTMPVQLAQEMKQATYKALGNKSYGELKGASTEAQKAIARGLKNEISDAVPSVGALNKSEGELLNALNVAERRVLMGMNNNPGGLAFLANSPGMMAAFLADKSDLFKSVVARMINAGSARVPALAGQSVGATVGALSGQE